MTSFADSLRAVARYICVAISLSALVALGACDTTSMEDDGEEEPDPEGPTVNLGEQAPPGIHDKFAQVADQVPGFGGFYLDETGQPIAFAIEPTESRREELRVALRQAFGDGILERGDNPRRSVENPTLEVRAGEYRMRDLLAWYERLPEVFDVEEVVMTDLNEARNRLSVGVTTEEVFPQVEDRIAELDIPREAVRLVVKSPPREASNGLRDRVTPPRGGVEVSGTCTLGFVGRYQGDWGFITNSHCTNQRGNNTGTTFNQPASGPQIGVESADPSYRSCGFLGFNSCRKSDAAFVDFDGCVSVATDVMRTQNWAAPGGGTGSRQIDHGAAMDMTEFRAHPVSGQMVDKMGRTSGWTYGFVTRTCTTGRPVDNSGNRITVDNDPVLMKCQYEASYRSDGGDSGSPVFLWRGDTVILVGLNWGSGSNYAIFSPLEGIWEDF